MAAEVKQRGVVVVQPCLPHYRVPFFTELSSRLDGKLVVVSGAYSFGGSPVSVSDTPDIKRINVRNIYLADQIGLQILPDIARSCPLAVLSFDVRTLSNLWLFAERRRRRLPTILWGHGLSRRPNSPAWVVRLRAKMAQWADALILYEDKGKEDFLELGLPAAKLFVAHNAIDTAAIRFAAQQFRPSRRDILFIGRLVPAKKADLLIEGFAYAVHRLPPATHLLIIGDGPERSRLETLVRRRNLTDRVDFIGEVTNEMELAPYFAQSALCVSPGGVGLSAIHSLAYGVPLLIADNEPHGPEIEVMIPGENGEYFVANGADALANRLVELLASPQQLALMGDNGRDLVQAKYSVQHMADVFLQTFSFVLRENQAEGHNIA